MDGGDLSKTIYGVALLAQFEHNNDVEWVMHEVTAMIPFPPTTFIGAKQQIALDAFEKLVILKGFSLHDGSLDPSSKDNQYPLYTLIEKERRNGC
jgi:hypothetical protein